MASSFVAGRRRRRHPLFLVEEAGTLQRRVVSIKVRR